MEGTSLPSSHPADPPAPRCGKARRIFTSILLLFFCAIIWAYWTLTNSARVKELAEDYLSKMLGAQVMIRHADFSIFEGLRLDNVSVYVGPDRRAEDLLFHARSFRVKTRLELLLRGKLEMSQILAIHPEVYLTEDIETGKWNFDRLNRQPRKVRTDRDKEPPIPLPEVLLRGGMIHYARLSGNQLGPFTSMAIDGQLIPTHSQSQATRYTFDLDSRLADQTLGPQLRGILDMDKPAVHATLDKFQFDQTFRRMLPAQVQEWWQRHQLTGRVSIPQFRFNFGAKNQPADFLVEIELDRVSLAVPPEELMGKRDFQRSSNQRFAIRPANFLNLGPASRMEFMEKHARPEPVMLSDVSGRFTFTPKQIRFIGARALIENNAVSISGIADGYSTEATARVHISADNINIPEVPRYLASMPADVRKLHWEFSPSGRGNVSVDLSRAVEGGDIQTRARLDIVDGAFRFWDFSYPLRHATGRIELGRDPVTGFERVDLIDLRGQGVSGSLNENTFVDINGWISPLDRNNAVEITVRASNIHLDSHVRRALPPEAREAVELFDGPPAEPGGPARPAAAFGSFDARIIKFPLRRRVYAYIDLALKEADGVFAHFPYPLHKATGAIRINPESVEIRNVVATNGNASVHIDGRVTFGRDRPVEPFLDVTARNVPVDADLKNALPPEQRQWLDKLGIGGTLNVRGKIFPKPPAKDQPPSREPLIDWDLDLSLAGGRVWQADESFAVHDATARFHLTSDQLEILSVSGKHASGLVTGSGIVAWPKSGAYYKLDVDAKAIPFAKPLYAVLPASGKKIWDELRPSGTVDFHVNYNSAAEETPKGPYTLTIHPAAMSVLPVTVPYRLDKLAGEAVVTSSLTTLRGITGVHGESIIHVDGDNGDDGSRSVWTLKVSGEKIKADDDLRKALPAGWSAPFTSTKLQGTLAFDCPEFKYSTPRDASSAPARAAATQPTVTESIIDFKNAVISLSDSSLELGVPLAGVSGSIQISGRIVDGDLQWLSGAIDVPSMQMVSRNVRDFKSDIVKPDGKNFYQFARMRGKLAGGNIAGQIDLAIPKKAPGRYAMAIVLRDCDVREIAQETGDKIRGRLSASLELAGDWNDTASRRGGGDISIQGNDLYRIPLVLDMLQITNLSLPIKSPFQLATSRYTIFGQKVTLEQIELSAPNMLMQGSGTLDFTTRKVALTFTTDNPNWPKLPAIGDLIQGVKNELFQIHVKGTIEEPKVSAKSFNTVQTTIDEVFRAKPSDNNGKKKDR